MKPFSYKWIKNTRQHGTQTEEGQWHSVPHPHLTVQIPYCATEGGSQKVTGYWHPDYLIFKGDTTVGSGWFIDQRTSACVEGPFKTKGEAKAAATD